MTQLVSTRNLQPVAQAVSVADQSTGLDIALREADAISRAGDVIPNHYRGKPGAVLLARQWADSRGVDLLTTMQMVSFVNAKPVVDASMQRALAARQGITVRVVEATETKATVTLTDATGNELGSDTYTIDEARLAGLAGKDNWKKHPKNMLVARASTRALKWFAPEVMLGLFDRDEAEELDPVATLAPVVAITPSAEPETTPAPDIVDAEVVDNRPPPPAEPADGEALTVDGLKAEIRKSGSTQAATIQHARTLASEHAVGEINALTDIISQQTPAFVDALLQRIAEGS